MNEQINLGAKANLRLDHINGDVADIKKEQLSQGILIRQSLVDMASLKTEVRIIGALILTIFTTLAIAYLTNIIP